MQGAAPLEPWAELDAVSASLAPRYRPMVIFAAATGFRPAEWLALEWRDIALGAQVLYVAFTDERSIPVDGSFGVRVEDVTAVAEGGAVVL